MTTPTCQCQHIALAHQYRPSTAANDGECLAPQCTCGGYESGESALGIRGNDVSTWENESHNKAAPGGASTPLIQGPRRLVKESTDG